MAVRSTLRALPLWLVLVDFWSNFANANLTVHPMDTMVLVNHSTYFNCSTSARNINANYVLWYHYSLNSATRNDVYDDGYIMFEYTDRFRIETNLAAGVFNLVVDKPSLADAGRYECQDGVGQGDKASAELLVLEGNPICKSNMPSDGVVGQNSCGLKPDDLWMTCRITSCRGNNPPTLEWRKSNDESSSSLAVCEHSTSCNLTLRGDQIRNGQSFVCHTAKSAEQYGCSTAPVKVKYALSWTEEITEAKGAVVCSSNTSQPCTYKWYNAKNEEVSIDENLHTTVPGEYKCEAQCEMNRTNESCRFTAMRVYVVAPDPYLLHCLWLLLIPVIIGVILAIKFRRSWLRPKYASAAVGKLEMPIRDEDYDILPYATSDIYDTIDEAVIDADLKVFFAPRQGPLPTPGYSGLMQTEPTAPGVYSRIDTYETPEDIAPGARNMKVLATLETSSEKQIDDGKEKKTGGEGNQTQVQPYLELFDAVNPETTSEKDVDDSDEKINGKSEENQSPVHPYIELVDVVVADDPEEYKRTSDFDIPSSYLTVNF